MYLLPYRRSAGRSFIGALGIALICATGGSADVFDISEGTEVTDHTPLLTGEVAEEMFGLVSDDGTEAGTVVFADQATLDYIHYVEWTMPEAVLVSRITVHAAGDECTGERRTFDRFRFVAIYDDGSDEELLDEGVPVPYDYEFDCEVLFTFSFPQTTAPKFRAEFTQYLVGGFSGPRVIELDGFAFGECGDATNDDGIVTTTDALDILTRAVGLDYCALCLCDATDDGVVTATDALAALNGAVGLTEYLNCPSCEP